MQCWAYNATHCWTDLKKYDPLNIQEGDSAEFLFLCFNWEPIKINYGVSEILRLPEIRQQHCGTLRTVTRIPKTLCFQMQFEVSKIVRKFVVPFWSWSERYQDSSLMSCVFYVWNEHFTEKAFKALSQLKMKTHSESHNDKKFVQARMHKNYEYCSNWSWCVIFVG